MSPEKDTLLGTQLRTLETIQHQAETLGKRMQVLADRLLGQALTGTQVVGEAVAYQPGGEFQELRAKVSENLARLEEI